MPSDVGWLLREAPPPVDATARFLQLYAAPPRTEARVLLVPGIFTRLYPAYLRRIRRAGLFLERTRRHLAEHHGAESDGFVPTADEAIPGAMLVTLRGLDHAALALPWLRPRAPYEAGRVAHALVALALERA